MSIATRNLITLVKPIANTYYVDFTNGSDSNNGRASDKAWKTIAKVNAATLGAGDRLLFKRGETWTGTALTAVGGVTYQDYGAGALPIIDGNNAVNCAVITNISGVTLRNIAVQNGLDFGFAFSGASYCVLDGCTANHCGNDNVIFISACHHCSVTNLTSHDAYVRVAGPISTCLEIADGSHDITVDNVALYNSANMGMSIHCHSGLELPYNITITNSTFRNNTQHGLNILTETGGLLHSTPSVVFTNCLMYSNTLQGINVTAAGTTIPSGITFDSCASYDNAAGGATTFSAYIRAINTLIKRCWFTSPREKCVQFDKCQSLTVENNTFYVIAGTAFQGCVQISDATTNGITLENNIVAVNTTGCVCITVATGAGTGVVADYNLYYTPSGAGGNRWQWNGGSLTTFANWKTQSSQDAHSPTPANPLFTNAGANDFTLQGTSPAIDKGVVILGITDGYLGIAPDCGYSEKA